MIGRIEIRGYRVFRRLTLEPDPVLNVIVGDNETGKSTLLEALSLALSGRIDGPWANEELNPYWFNLDDVRGFFKAYEGDPTTKPPEISIELFLNSADSDVQRMRGIHNTL